MGEVLGEEQIQEEAARLPRLRRGSREHLGRDLGPAGELVDFAHIHWDRRIA